jgi:hypothetical protein
MLYHNVFCYIIIFTDDVPAKHYIIRQSMQMKANSQSHVRAKRMLYSNILTVRAHIL